MFDVYKPSKHFAFYNDKLVDDIIKKEYWRQKDSIQLIASENYTSARVLKYMSNIFTNKYAEGYPNKRYYNGCKFFDSIESLAIERAKKLFKCNFANVQPHSGASANLGVYKGLIKTGDTILSMSLAAGGHLTHGAKPTLIGQYYNIVNYETDDNDMPDYKKMEELALEHKPKLIIIGGSANPRIWDIEKAGKIAKSVGAYLLADMAHFSAQIASGYYPNPLKWADVVTTTTHKVLRGPRGGLILSNDPEIATKIDKGIFPGTQGGPLGNAILAKAVAFEEADTPDFKDYIKNVLFNAKTLGNRLVEHGYQLISGGTDTHLLLVDLRNTGLNGDIIANALETADIIVNKNGIPHDPLPPMKTSGIRIGTSLMTTRGCSPDDFNFIGDLIHKVISSLPSNLESFDKIDEVTLNNLKVIKMEVAEFCNKLSFYVEDK